MSEEARDWCVTKFPFSDKHFYVKLKWRVVGNEMTFASGLTKEEALALLAAIGKVEIGRLWDAEFYAYLKE